MTCNAQNEDTKWQRVCIPLRRGRRRATIPPAHHLIPARAPRPASLPRLFSPQDVVESETTYHLKIDAPGFDAADFEVSLLEGVLTVAAKREAALEAAPEGARVLRRERVSASFSRSFRLPADVDAAAEEGITAHFHNGVLELVLRKAAPAPKPEPTHIRVTTPAAEGEQLPTHATGDAEAAVAAEATAAAEAPASAEATAPLTPAAAEDASPAIAGGEESWTKVEAKASDA
jgi:HSP20 family protein